MAGKKVIVPLVGTNVKKDDEEKGRSRGRPALHELSAVVAKSFEIIQTVGAGPRTMGLVAVAYFDDEFVAYREGERVRLRNVFRQLGKKGINSRQTNYKRLLERCKIEYRWLVNASEIETPEGRLLYLIHKMAQAH